MPPVKTSRAVSPARVTLLLLVAVAAALGLAACGSSGSSSSSATSTSAEPPAAEAGTETEAGSAGEAEEVSAATAGGGLTPPGTELATGEAANVAWVPPGEFDPTKAQAGIELEATVEAIEEGSAGDLKNIELEASVAHAIPFYVRIKIEAPETQKIANGEDPALALMAIDDREEEQGSVTFLGSFPTCEEVPAPKSIGPGEPYETCLTYLLNGGGSIQKVQWNSGPEKPDEVSEYFESPIVWTSAAG
jgi:hypothetical protein